METSASIRWEGTIPLLRSRFYLLDVATVVAISVFVLHALFFVLGLVVDGRPAVLPWELGAGLGLGLLLLMLLVTLVVFPSGIEATFTVDDDKVTVSAGARLRRVNRVVLFLATLSGRVAVVGPALTASSREDTEVPYREIRAVWFHQRQRVIEIRDDFFRMTRLFCPPDRYDEIAARVRAGMVAAPRGARPFHWHGLLPGLGWSIIAAAAFVLGLAWAPDEIGAPLLAAAIAAGLAGWLRGPLAQLLGGVGLACAAAAAIIVLQLAMVSTDFGAGIVLRGYEHQPRYLGFTSVGLAALTLLSAARLLRAREGH